MRDGVLVYGCADASACPATTVQGFTGSHAIPAGFYGLDPGAAGLHRSRCISVRARPSPTVFNSTRTRTTRALDGYNIVGYRFASPIENQFNTYIGRVDYRATAAQSLFVRLNFQNDAVGSTSAVPRTGAEHHEQGARAVAARSVTTGCSARTRSTPSATATRTSSRTPSDCRQQSRISFRFIDDFQRADGDVGPPDADAQLRGRLQLDQGQPHAEVRHEPALHARAALRQHVLVQQRHHQRARGWSGAARSTRLAWQNAPAPKLPAPRFLPFPPDFQATFADSLAPLLGIVSETRPERELQR